MRLNVPHLYRSLSFLRASNSAGYFSAICRCQQQPAGGSSRSSSSKQAAAASRWRSGQAAAAVGDSEQGQTQGAATDPKQQNALLGRSAAVCVTLLAPCCPPSAPCTPRPTHLRICHAVTDACVDLVQCLPLELGKGQPGSGQDGALQRARPDRHRHGHTLGALSGAGADRRAGRQAAAKASRVKAR